MLSPVILQIASPQQTTGLYRVVNVTSTESNSCLISTSLINGRFTSRPHQSAALTKKPIGEYAADRLGPVLRTYAVPAGTTVLMYTDMP